MTDKTNGAVSFRRYPFSFFAIILLLSCLTHLFSSCEREENVSGNGGIVLVPATGELVAVSFTVGERDFGNSGISVRHTAHLPTERGMSWSADASEPAQWFLLSPPSGELEGVSYSLYLYASLVENETPVRLRASRLEEDTKVRVVAYDIVSVPNDTIQITFADYVVVSGGSLVPQGAHPMMVPSGSVLFVAYSFNDALAMPAFTDTVLAIGSRDLLWGDTLVTVGIGNMNVHILLDHLFAKIKVEAEADFPSPAPSLIHTIFGARYDHTFPALTVHSGELTPGDSAQIPVDWQAAGSASIWPGKDHFVYTNGNPPVVTIDSVLIDGTIYKDPAPPWRIEYATPLVAGNEYTLKVRFIPPTLSVSTNSLLFAKCVDGSGVQQSVTVATNDPAGWDYSMSGAHASDFTVIRSGHTLTVYPNPNPCCAPRTATLTVTAADGLLTETITVTQDATWIYGYTGNYQIFTPICSGTYQIELWGAGSRYTVGGGYVKGEFSVGPAEAVQAGQNLYIYVGGEGTDGTGLVSFAVPGGYNGGGNALRYRDTNSGSGGGATDIRYFGSNYTPSSAELIWNSTIGLRSRVMVAGGGGGFVSANSLSPGSGGGLSGITGSVTYNPDTYTAAGGTQTAGGNPGVTPVPSNLQGLIGSFGQGGNGGTVAQMLNQNDSTTLGQRSGGGGGYYGGGSYILAGGGGSSFISGHPGCNALNSLGTHSGQSNHFSGVVFTSTEMTEGNANMPNPYGGMMIGNTGNGFVIITYIGP